MPAIHNHLNHATSDAVGQRHGVEVDQQTDAADDDSPMIISHRRRFTFFHNPKAAGIGLRAVLAPCHDDPTPLQGSVRRPPFDYQLDFTHLRLWESQALFPAVLTTASTYRSLIFVRDPYSRFVSAIDQHFKTCCPDLPLLQLPAEQQRLLIETFAETVLHRETVRAGHRFIHFSPQAWFLQSGARRLPAVMLPMDDHGGFIARGLQSLGLPPRPVPQDNRSRLDLTPILMSPKIRACVRGFYAEDFDFWPPIRRSRISPKHSRSLHLPERR